jgi:hypothetical protein
LSFCERQKPEAGGGVEYLPKFLTDGKDGSWGFETEVMEIIDGGGAEAKLGLWARCVIRGIITTPV